MRKPSYWNKAKVFLSKKDKVMKKLINSYKDFDFLDKNSNLILKLKTPFIEKAIINSCKLKKKVIEE